MSLIKPGALLAEIDSPRDLRKLEESQLPQLCDELRQYIVDNVSIYGGHFGASLGVVELTAAMHYAFETPDDLLVWDVGHQAYGHKILTGRRDQFHTNRKLGGLSGFPKRDESPYDTFGVGHSSTSISAALGMAVADRLKGIDRQHVAIIGDGAMTAGLAFEGMNHAGVEDSNIIIVLNDNCMSIDPNVGALKEYLTDISTSGIYNRFRDEMVKLANKLEKYGTPAKELLSRIDHSFKSFLLKQSNLFESLNLRYFGPVDGHDVNHLVKTFQDLKKLPGPKLLHCITVKGKGFAPAEKDQTKWHAPGKFDKITGEIQKKIPTSPQPPKYQEVFGHTIVELAEQNERIVGVTPAMPSGSSLNIMMKAIPDRAFDVGIAEQHAVTFSAGLATEGMVVFCNIYSTFMQRAYDQVIHDVCIQDLPVNFCLDRAGFAGADGATHHGAYDIAYMRCLPNMVVAAPMNEAELRNMMFTAQLPRSKGAFTIRYPRGQGIMPNWKTPMKAMEIGKARCVSEGQDVAVLSLGHIGNYVTEAAKRLAVEQISVEHWDMRFAKPLDENALHQIFGKFSHILTVEDGCLMGGFGSAILEFMADHGYQAKVRRLGIPDQIIEQGEQIELHAQCGFDPEAIIQEVQLLVADKSPVLAQ